MSKQVSTWVNGAVRKLVAELDGSAKGLFGSLFYEELDTVIPLTKTFIRSQLSDTVGGSDKMVASLLGILGAIDGKRQLGYFQETFFEMPEVVYFTHGDTACSFPQAKRVLVAQIATQWHINDTSPESVDVLRFLIAAGWPDRGNQPVQANDERWLVRSRGRWSLDEVEKAVKDAIRVRSEAGLLPWSQNYGVFPELDGFHFWFTLADIPDEILGVLAMARTKFGGVRLSKLDQANWNVLAGVPEEFRGWIAEQCAPVQRAVRGLEALKGEFTASKTQAFKTGYSWSEGGGKIEQIHIEFRTSCSDVERVGDLFLDLAQKHLPDFRVLISIRCWGSFGKHAPSCAFVREKFATAIHK